MSEEIYEKALKDPDSFKKSFDDGKYPKLLGSSSGWDNYDVLSSTNYLKDLNWDYIDHTDIKPIDFILQNWELKFWSSHSHISKKKNVDYAWEIITDSTWKILSINNNSWHYKPWLEWFEEAKIALESKF